MTHTVSKKKSGLVTSDLLTFFFLRSHFNFRERNIRPPQELGKCEWEERGGNESEHARGR